MAGGDDERIAQILQFWFGGDGAPMGATPERSRLWFGGEEETDDLIRSRFAGLVDQALAGGLSPWEKSPRAALALILLLDQFPRNIFRHSPRAYAGDSRSLPLSRRYVTAGRERPLPILWRAFFYLPLEHAEELAAQDLSVAAFRRLAAEAPAELAATCRDFLDYALRHREIIARFGRFPHRNAVLGRTSTAAELAFLATPGSSF